MYVSNKMLFSFLFTKIYIVYSMVMCEDFLNNPKSAQILWSDLEACLPSIGKSTIDKKTAENLWRLIKEANDGVENIPISVYKNMGNILSGIPIEDLKNVAMDQIEIVEAFGSVFNLDEDQMKLIAKKVRREWGNKTPEKYSEYDLIALRNILCYFNEIDILAIHPDAYKEAAEVIGELNKCSQEVINAFAKLAVQPEAFGPTKKWTKLIVNSVGNVITGLSPLEYDCISPESLTANRQYINQSSTRNYTSRTSNCSSHSTIYNKQTETMKSNNSAHE